jgi:hypothetical protein
MAVMAAAPSQEITRMKTLQSIEEWAEPTSGFFPSSCFAFQLCVTREQAAASIDAAAFSPFRF